MDENANKKKKNNRKEIKLKREMKNNEKNNKKSVKIPRVKYCNGHPCICT